MIMEDEAYHLFGTEMPKEVVLVFKQLYKIALDKKVIGLKGNQKEILTRVSAGQSYSQIMDSMDKKHIHSIQSGIKGGVKNLMKAIIDTAWLYNNPQLIEWMEKNAGKHV